MRAQAQDIGRTHTQAERAQRALRHGRQRDARGATRHTHAYATQIEKIKKAGQTRAAERSDRDMQVITNR